jgi:thymidine phosphorylase
VTPRTTERSARNSLLLKRLGIDTHEEPVVYMQADCDVCRSEGFSAHSRVRVTTDRASIIATLNVLRNGFLLPTEAGLSEAAWRLLGAEPGQIARFSHPRPVDSLGAVRAKIFGHAFQETQLLAILQDMTAGRYTDIDLSAFLTACAATGMSLDEVVWLTRGMVHVGERVRWEHAVVADKHCVGGLPGNRTTPIIVAIVAAAGVCIPKTWRCWRPSTSTSPRCDASWNAKGDASSGAGPSISARWTIC